MWTMVARLCPAAVAARRRQEAVKNRTRGDEPVWLQQHSRWSGPQISACKRSIRALPRTLTCQVWPEPPGLGVLLTFLETATAGKAGETELGRLRSTEAVGACVSVGVGSVGTYRARVAQKLGRSPPAHVVDLASHRRRRTASRICDRSLLRGRHLRSSPTV